MPIARPLRSGSLLFSAALALVLAAACSNQGEGGRCSTLGDTNGDGECQAGFHCYPARELNNTQVDLCCPWDRRLATVPECAIAAPLFNSDASVPATADASDGSAADVSTTPDVSAPPDAGRDASVSEASPVPAEGSVDASADATADVAAD